MLNQIETKNKLSSIAETVRAEILFDLNFKLDFNLFFKLKFSSDSFKQSSILDAIYKYYN